MVSCAVVSCKNNSVKFSKDKHGITFHRFPRDKERRRQWELAVNRGDEWICTKSSVICCEHFDVRDFYLTDSGLRRLATDAVPTLNISPCQEPEPTLPEVGPADIKPDDSEEVVRLKHKVHRLEILAEDRRKRLNLMCQRKYRLKKKLRQFRAHIIHLIKFKQSTTDTEDR